MTAPLVTICCVLTPAHRRLFRRNHKLIRRINPGVRINWEIVENIGLPLDYAIWKAILQKGSDDKHVKRYERYCASLADGLPETEPTDDRRVHIGYTIAEVAESLRRRHLDDPDIDTRVEQLIVTADGRAQKLAGSYHHAFGLSRAIAAAGGRFLALLDPDFYVVRPDWIVDVINHMINERLAIFGAPWHPFWFNKFRDFPCTHFMIVDRTRIEIRPDDVLPDLMHDIRLPNDPVMREWAGADGRPPPGLLRRAFTLPSLLLADYRQRPLISRSRDTGFMIHATHGEKGVHECVIPVIGDMTAADLKPRVVSPLQLLLDHLYRPGRRYWVRDRVLGLRRGFQERGLPSVRAAGWEEFIWKGAPFAFHVRGQLVRTEGGGVDTPLMKSVLGHVGSERPEAMAAA